MAAGCSSGSDEEGTAGRQRTFFGSDSIGSIEVEFDQAELDAMLTTFGETGEKEWIEADVTIDGITYRQAGLRLKGNSSLFALMPPSAFTHPDPSGVATGGSGDVGEMTEIDPDCFPEGMGDTGLDSTATGGDEPANPATLPWLIRLDKFVEDQAHQGRTRFAVRGSNDPVPLVEALALDLLGRSGLASQRFTMVRFGVNGGDDTLRLVVEVPDGRWMDDTFGPDGALYKADSTGDYEYRGEEPSAYDTAWSQDGGEDDLEPLIDFLRFIDESTDQEFVDQLDEHLDVDAFVRYLAFQGLIANSDDITGPGNNSYLHVDADGRATVVAWDHNLAFAGSTGESTGSSIGVAIPGPAVGDSDDASAPPLPEGCELPELPTMSPDDSIPPAGSETDPDDSIPPAGSETDPDEIEIAGPSNPLVERFLNTPELVDLVEAARVELKALLFDSGVAADSLRSLASTVRDGAADLADDEAIEQLVEAITTWFPKE